VCATRRYKLIKRSNDKQGNQEAREKDKDLDAIKERRRSQKS